MPDSSALYSGQKVGRDRFTLVRPLGRGGMGEVWLARDERLQEPVALKFLPPEVRADPAALDDLRRETARSHRLTHPHIVRIHDLHEEADGSAFIAMEYVDGPTLAALRLEQPERVLPWEYLRPLIEQLCAALDYAHGERVIHRDLKPGNIMVDGKGRLKLADFGIAATVSDSVSRISNRHSTGGTLAYMSPQQLAGKHPQVADDLYALGATLYELLTSKPPFYSGDVTHQVLHETPEPPAVRLASLGVTNSFPSDVAALVMACLAKDPALRPPSARAVAAWVGLEVAPKPSLDSMARSIASGQGLGPMPANPVPSEEVWEEPQPAVVEAEPAESKRAGIGTAVFLLGVGVFLGVVLAGGVLWHANNHWPYHEGNSQTSNPGAGPTQAPRSGDSSPAPGPLLSSAVAPAASNPPENSAGAGAGPEQPQTNRVSGAGLWVGDFAGQTNAGSADGVGNQAQFRFPCSLDVDQLGNLYVCCANTIRLITPAAKVSTIAGAAGAIGATDGPGAVALFNSPNAVAVNRAGIVYVADSGNHTLRKLTRNGGGWEVSTFAGMAGSTGSADGPGTAARFSNPKGLAIDREGDLYVADANNEAIRKVTAAGQVSTLAGRVGMSGSADGPGSIAQFNSPRAVAVDGLGNVFVADWGNFTVRKVSAAGVVSTLAGMAGRSGSVDGPARDARFNSPRGLAVDGAGNVYVADFHNSTIRKITASGMVTTVAGLAGHSGNQAGTGSRARLFNPCALVVNGPATLFYIADTANHSIRKGFPTGTQFGSANTAAALSR